MLFSRTLRLLRIPWCWPPISTDASSIPLAGRFVARTRFMYPRAAPSLLMSSAHDLRICAHDHPSVVAIKVAYWYVR